VVTNLGWAERHGPACHGERAARRSALLHCLALGGMDLTSPAGKMTMGVIAAVAEFERATDRAHSRGPRPREGRRKAAGPAICPLGQAAAGNPSPFGSWRVARGAGARFRHQTADAHAGSRCTCDCVGTTVNRCWPGSWPAPGKTLATPSGGARGTGIQGGEPLSGQSRHEANLASPPASGAQVSVSPWSASCAGSTRALSARWAGFFRPGSSAMGERG